MSSKEEVQLCSTHNLELDFFCLTCKKAACTECENFLDCQQKHEMTKMKYAIDTFNQEMCCSHNQPLDFFCLTCKTAVCRECEHFLHQQNHEIVTMKNAVSSFNHEATELLKTAQKVKKKLEKTFHSITASVTYFKDQVDLCRKAIKVQEKKIIQAVQANTRNLILQLDEIQTTMEEGVKDQFEDLDRERDKVNEGITSVNSILNKPQEFQTIVKYKASIIPVEDKVDSVCQSFHARTTVPNFRPSKPLTDLINKDNIGKITVHSLYKVAESDQQFAVTEGQTFEVTVSRLILCPDIQLTAVLTSKSGQESITEIKHLGNGEYRIIGRCDREGDWQLKIMAKDVEIKGSPVNVTVEPSGLVETIDNIGQYKENEKCKPVVDVALDKDGCILVSSDSKEVLKFEQSGLFKDKQDMTQNVRTMHPMSDGRMVFSDNNKSVILCDDQFQEIRRFGNETFFKEPLGLTVNKDNVLYVADCKAHCVYKFNINNGDLLGKIGCEEIRMKGPHHITLTKDGNLVVCDTKNHRVLIFGENDKITRIIEDPLRFSNPYGVAADYEDNIIISSNHELQLFNKHGDFIKQIGSQKSYFWSDLCRPKGICVISKHPRKVAVANVGSNNVKIFNY